MVVVTGAGWITPIGSVVVVDVGTPGRVRGYLDTSRSPVQREEPSKSVDRLRSLTQGTKTSRIKGSGEYRNSNTGS